MGAKDATLYRNTASFTAAAAKFGSAGLAGGVYAPPAGIDSVVSSTGTGGGTVSGGTAGFTIEAWFKTTATSVRVIAGHEKWYWLGVNVSGQAQLRYGSTSANEIDLHSTGVVNDGAWHHIAACFINGLGYLAIDGVVYSSSAAAPVTAANGAGLLIAGFTAANTYDWSGAGGGLIDEVRISNTARYTGTTYTVPTAAFTVDGLTAALYHLEADGTDAVPAAGSGKDAVLYRNTSAFSAAAAKFGSGGLAGGVYATPTSADSGVSSTGAAGGQLNGGSTGFTIEAWAKTTATSTRVVVGHDQWYWFGMASNGAMNLRYGSSAGTEIVMASSAVVNDGAWHHMAAVFTTTAVYLCLDGVVVASAVMKAAGSPTAPALIGGISSTGSASDWAASGSGVIDEVRFSNVARYTGSYTVPTTAFTSDANTVALYHLEADATDSASTTASTAPGAPTNLTATASSGQVALSWTAPSTNGGSAITDYIVEYQPSGGSWTTFADGTGITTAATVTGLTNGTPYTFRVSAVNAIGTGSVSSTASATPAAVTTTPGLIAPNDSNFVYSPYNWLVTATSAKTINAGAYFRCMLTGTPTSITLNFDLTNSGTPLPQITYRIDGGAWTNTEIAASIALTLPSGNSWTKHVVEFRVKSTTESLARWASPQLTAVVFTGISVLPTSGVATAPIRKRKLNILTYGDSITEGVRTLNSGASKDTDRNDSSMSWAFPLGDLMGAEVGVVGFGGSGYSKNGSGAVPPLNNSYNLLWANQARTFTPAPDLVIVNLGTNDGTADITAAMKVFLNGVLAATPATTKIAVVLPWKGTLGSYMQAAIAGSDAPSRITFISTTGWWSTSDAPDALHPYGYVNLMDLSPRLALILRDILGKAKISMNVGGTAVPITATTI